MSYNPAYYPTLENSILRGTLLMTMINFEDDPADYYTVYINGIIRDREYRKTNGLDSWQLYVGDVVRVEIDGTVPTYSGGVLRRDYTTKDLNENDGIYETDITPTLSGNSITFTATTINSSYNFEYEVELEIIDGSFIILTENSDYIQAESSAYINYEH
jgi:hypothetical protein